MVRAFYVDPIAKTVKPCKASLVDDIADRIGQAHYDITFCAETADYEMVEYSATVWPYKYCCTPFELGETQYRGSAIVVVHTKDKVTPEMLGIAF
jgi:hypothetical protein